MSKDFETWPPGNVFAEFVMYEKELLRMCVERGASQKTLLARSKKLFINRGEADQFLHHASRTLFFVQAFHQARKNGDHDRAAHAAIHAGRAFQRVCEMDERKMERQWARKCGVSKQSGRHAAILAEVREKISHYKKRPSASDLHDWLKIESKYGMRASTFRTFLSRSGWKKYPTLSK